MKTQFTQWNTMGDHPLVKENTCHEFEYEQAASRGCGFINTFIMVYPTNYIVEVNDVFVGVINQATYEQVKNKEQEIKADNSNIAITTEDKDKVDSNIMIVHSKPDNPGEQEEHTEAFHIHSNPDSDAHFILFKNTVERHVYFYSEHAESIVHELKAIDSDTYARIFKQYSNLFIDLFAKTSSSSSQNYPYRVEKTIDVIFDKLNHPDVIGSYEYKQLFTLSNPFVKYLVNFTQYDTFMAFITRHADFIGEYKKVLVDSFLLKNLVDFNDLNDSSFSYLKKVISNQNFEPNFQFLDRRWAKSFDNADFDYKITSPRFKIIKMMIEHNFLKASRYNFSEKDNAQQSSGKNSIDNTKHQPTFFELFILDNIYQAQNQPAMFKYLLAEIEQLEALGVQKVISLNPKECFYYNHKSIDNPEDYDTINCWNRFIDATKCVSM
jgi:hypothetical protein